MRAWSWLPLLLLIAAAPAVRAQPAMYRGGPEHTGVYPASGGVQYAGRAWRFMTGGAVRSTPVLTPDQRIVFGSTDGRLYALSLGGEPIWSAQLGSPIASSPAVADGVALVQSRDDLIVAVSARDGRILWRKPAAPAAPLPWGLESGDLYQASPTIAEGRVVIGGVDGSVSAFDLHTGKLFWRFLAGGRVRTAAAVAGGTVYAPSFDGSLYALDLKTGGLRWRFDTLGHSLNSGDFGFDRRSIQSAPAVADGMVVFGARDGLLWAVDAATGKERWRFDHEIVWVIGGPAIANGRVFDATSDDAIIQAFDLKTGKALWKDKMSGVAWPSPAVSGDTVFFADSNGGVGAFDAASGRKLWKAAVPGGVYGSPVPIPGALLVPSHDGALYAFRLSEKPVRRLVYWDEAYKTATPFDGGEGARDALKRDGWTVIDAAALEALLADPASARGTTVTFAIDAVPQALVSGGEAAPLRRWLEAGGRAVWLDVPPGLMPRDPKTGEALFSLKTLDRSGLSRMLGVDFSRANFDPWGAVSTPAGARFGLDGAWVAAWAADARSVDVVLASDENRKAAAWIKRYGAGGAFVMLNRTHRAWPSWSPLVIAADTTAGLRP